MAMMREGHEPLHEPFELSVDDVLKMFEGQ